MKNIFKLNIFIIAIFILIFPGFSYARPLGWNKLSSALKQQKLNTAITGFTATATSPKTIKIKGKDYAQLIQGKFAFSKSLSKPQIAKLFIKNYHQSLVALNNKGQAPNDTDLTIKKEGFDKLKGNSIVRVQQSIQGIPIFGSDIAVHINKNSQVEVVSGKIYAFDKVNLQPSITAQTALVAAQQNLRASTNATIISTTTPTLMIFEKNGIPCLTWQIIFKTKKPLGEWYYFVSANKPKILAKFNNIKNAYTKNWDTYDAQNNENLPGVLALHNNQTSADDVLQKIHTNVSLTMDYFYNTFGRKSFDDSSATVIASGHFYVDYENAFWDGEQLAFGDGNLTYHWAPFGNGLDIVAHELGHAVTDYTANLIYYGQSGALNESMSDIWGAMVDRRNWIIGEDIYYPEDPTIGLRYFDDPEQGEQPAKMQDYIFTYYDDGGVHYNSGITNKAFYLIATAIGKENSEQIYYRALTNYFTSSTDFLGARFGLLQAAEDLFGANSTYLAKIQEAFDAVGIIDIAYQDFTGTYVDYPLSSPHPYAANTIYTHTISHPGARGIKLLFNNIDTESGYDWIFLKNKDGLIVDSYSEEWGSFTTYPIKGDTVKIELVTDGTINYNGFDLIGYYYDLPSENIQNEVWATLNYSTPHPYATNQTYTKQINIPEANSIRLKLYEFNTVEDIDILQIKDKDSTVIAQYSGAQSGAYSILTSRVPGNEVNLVLNTHNYSNYYGFDVIGAYYSICTANINSVLFDNAAITENRSCSVTTPNLQIKLTYHDADREVVTIPTVTLNIAIKNATSNLTAYSTTINGQISATLNLTPSADYFTSSTNYYISCQLADSSGVTNSYQSPNFLLILSSQGPTNSYNILEHKATDNYYSTPTAYQAGQVYSKTLYFTNAKAISVYFKKFKLAGTDKVILRNKWGDAVATYTGDLGAFVSEKVLGDQVTIEFTPTSVSTDPDYGFEIDTSYVNTELPVDISTINILANSQACTINSGLVVQENLNMQFNLGYFNQDNIPAATLNVQLRQEITDTCVYNQSQSGQLSSTVSLSPDIEGNRAYYIFTKLDQDFGTSYATSNIFVYLKTPTNNAGISEHFFSPQLTTVTTAAKPIQTAAYITAATATPNKIYKLSISDAKSFSVVFSEMNLGTAKVVLKDKANNVVEEYTGHLGTFLSKSLMGDEAIIEVYGSNILLDQDFKILGGYYAAEVAASLDAILFNGQTIQNNDFISENPEVLLKLTYFNTAATPSVTVNITLRQKSDDKVMWQETQKGLLSANISIHPDTTSLPENTAAYLRVKLDQDSGTSYLDSPTFLISRTLTIKNLLAGPNPFNPKKESTHIQYNLSKAANGELYIYSINGERMWHKKISETEEGGRAGFNSIEWDGSGSNRSLVANGLYVAYLFLKDGTTNLKNKVKIAVIK